MNDYIITQTGMRSFVLTRNEVVLGDMNYVKWSPSKAAIQLADGTSYRIEPRGFWQRTTEVLENGQPLYSFRFTWRKGIEITSMRDAIPQKWFLKTKGFWKGTLQLLDENGQQLLFIEPRYRWKIFKTELLITTSLPFEKTPKKELLLMVTGAAFHYQQRIAAAAAT
ncbi:MAG: hypothetical protein EOO05_17495 [Chitinophagaceae bacterium]|nr:MAG: hypothetical protein EOO05_17495 [Chitinophagaceae bacterium]